MVRKVTRMGLEGDLAAMMMKLVLERTCGRAAQVPAETERSESSCPSCAHG